MRLFTALFLCAFLLIDADAALNRAREAMALWSASVAPALFPFFALLPALTDEEALLVYERLFGKIMKRLFRASGASAAPCLVGLIAGSPAGSIAIRSAFQSGAISKKDARILAALSTGAGPVFIVSSVGGGMMNDASAGVRLLFCAWLSSFLTAFLISRIRKGGEDEFFEGKRPINSPGAIREAVIGILTVAGYMTVFNVFAGGLPDMLFAFFEISGGCFIASQMHSFVMAAAVIGFGGVCLISQNYASLKKTGMGFAEFFAVKALSCALCTAFAWIMPEMNRFPIQTAPDGYMFSCALAVLMALVCAVYVFRARLEKNIE